MVREIKSCRLCSDELDVIYDLGKIYVSTFLKPGESGVRAPLRLAQCKGCGLVQLKDQVEMDDMYRQYWYRSGLNKSMRYDLKDIARSAEDIVTFEPGDIVIDIGTNDGTLLSQYFNNQILKVGFDPALNLKDRAEKNCDVFINDYFSADLYPKGGWDRAKVITAIAMFYDLPDPHKFVEDVKKLLHFEGIFIIQVTDLFSIFNHTMVDSICHEHLEYYKMWDIIHLMEEHNLEVFRVERNNVNGGSTRFYIAHRNCMPVEPLVDVMVKAEEIFFNSTRGSVEFFKNSVGIYREKIKATLKKFNNVYALAASTKGNTLLQVMNLTNKDIKAIGDINEDKFGLKTPGSSIKIISEQEVLDANPDLIVVLAWHFTETFREVLKDHLKRGGLVLYPLPYPYIQKDNGGWIV